MNGDRVLELPTSAVELRDALRTGSLTAREVTEHFLGRIEAENPRIGAFVSVTADSALAEADAADRQVAATPAGDRHGLPSLLGMPIAHKDIVDVAGAPTTHGSRALPHRVADTDSPIAQQLRASGAISLGKTQVPELGLSSYSENDVAPPARNPLDPERTPGGSSGGAAAAVAAGMLPLSPGSDGGGSVRIPALACGLIGLKPGFGAVRADTLLGDTDPFGAPRLVTSGPLAHSAADAALLYDAMTRVSGTTSEPALEAVVRAEDLGPLRIGVSLRSPFESAMDVALSPEALLALEAGIAALSASGHRVEEAPFSYDPRYTDAFTTAWTSALALLDFDAEAEERLGALARSFRVRSIARDPGRIREAGAILQQFAADADAQWGKYDVVLTPGLAFLPPRIGSNLALTPDEDYRQQCLFTPFTSMVNVSGLPAIAVPTIEVPATNPQAARPLSMGVQLIAPRGGEIRLLQLAAQMEARLAR